MVGTRWLLGLAVALVLVATGAGPAGAASPGPFFAAGFQVHRNAFTFGQTPAWTVGGEVLSNDPDRSGIEQVFRSRLDGRGRTCLTCGRLPGPNGFPEERPQGDWILFCSMGGQPEHYGAPCLGGYGTDLYVIRPDGRDLTRLTAATDPADGTRYDRPGGVAYDNYHAYWSPDGRHLIWTRTEAYPLSEGGQRWEMLLGDFVAPPGGAPHLTHVRVVGPAFGVYETQAWAPDGSGFLFTAFGPRASPYQPDAPGWMHLELYFMRLHGRGASPAHPRVTHLTDNDPAYEEQAVFTPDMREVIVMTNRAQPATWYETVIAAAQYTGFDAPDPGAAGTPMFVSDFTDPSFTSDLYMVDIATGAVRQLTNFRHVIPEFEWNFDYTRLLWSENLRPSGRITRVASFTGVSVARRRIPRGVAPALFGRPIDLARVKGSIRPVHVAPLVSADAFGIPRARMDAGDRQSLPPVVATYISLLFGQLRQLAALAALKIEQPPL